MGKTVECGKVDPSSGCEHAIRGATDEEVMAKVKANIRNGLGHSLLRSGRSQHPNTKGRSTSGPVSFAREVLADSRDAS